MKIQHTKNAKYVTFNIHYVCASIKVNKLEERKKGKKIIYINSQYYQSQLSCITSHYAPSIIHIYIYKVIRREWEASQRNESFSSILQITFSFFLSKVSIKLPFLFFLSLLLCYATFSIFLSFLFLKKWMPAYPWLFRFFPSV